MAQIAYRVSTEQKLWNYDVNQGTVLYLALEDDYQRLQERMSRMFGVEGTDSLHFAVYAKQHGAGLDEQLEKFIREHSDTQLIILTHCRRFVMLAPMLTAILTTVKSSHA